MDFLGDTERREKGERGTGEENEDGSDERREKRGEKDRGMKRRGKNVVRNVGKELLQS